MGSGGRLGKRLARLAVHPKAERWLAAVCAVEAFALPAFPEIMLAPMIMADRTRAWRLGFICTISSVLGALVGYAIGMFAFDLVGRPLLDLYGYGDDFTRLAAKFDEAGWLITLVGAISPIPYKVFTISAGVAGMDLATFLVFGLIGRAVRYAMPIALLTFFGPAIMERVRGRPRTVLLASIALVVGGTAAGALLF